MVNQFQVALKIKVPWEFAWAPNPSQTGRLLTLIFPSKEQQIPPTDQIIFLNKDSQHRSMKGVGNQTE